ncbi:MAG TPA: hypothetical protein VEW95_02895 [Candidatus Limnocylindrales bacterium]|nr:hypothetical protein [Candidatus Limnocylindrales bacterium]
MGLRVAGGITAAREALRALQQASDELARLRAPAETGSDAGAIVDRRDDIALALVKAVSAVRASEYALAHVAPRFANRAKGLRQEVMLGRARTRLLSEELDEPPAASRSMIPARRWLAAGSGRGRAARPALLGTGVLLVASVALGLAIMRPTAGLPAEQEVATAPPAREGIAGSNTESSDSPTPAALESTSPAPITDDHQFDDLAMGAALDAEWSVSGSEDNVVVAAYPTAIDRSLQMRGGPDDLQLCRVGASGSSASSAAVDFLFDLAVPPNARLLRLRAATGDVEVVTTEESTLVLNVPGQSIELTEVEPMIWYRVMLQARDGVLLVSLLDSESGVELSRSFVDHALELSAEAVCFELPAGAASDLYVDDLSITT